jgi:hypothetical protein
MEMPPMVRTAQNKYIPFTKDLLLLDYFAPEGPNGNITHFSHVNGRHPVKGEQH